VLYLFLSIFFNAILLVIIKLFAKFQVDTLQALVINYVTAFGVGLFFLENVPNWTTIPHENWFFGSVFLGFIFIATFYATTITSQQNGISVASVASKMSVIIPVGLGVLLYKEDLNFLKIIGIVLALIAVYFTTKKEVGSIEKSGSIWFPIFVFLGAGTIDSSLKYLQTYYVPEASITIFSSVTFLCAFFVGFFVLVYKGVKGTLKITGNSILGGIILGIPNFFSLYYLVKMIEAKPFESATLFTIHNIAIVLVSTLLGVIFFKEIISKRNLFGILLAIIALFLVTY